MGDKRAIILISFLFAALSLSAENGIHLQWEGVENHSYQIELQKDGTPLFVERLIEPEVTLDLSPGAYTYRVTFFNKFDKPDAWTDWIELTIIKDLEPVIINIPYHSIFAGDRPQKLEILVADIMDGALIRLEKDGMLYNPGTERKGQNRIELTLDTETMSPGAYDLHIINPSGSDTLLPGAILLKEKKPPLITDMEPRQALSGSQLPRVLIRGEDFDPDLVAFLERDGRRLRLPLEEYADEREIYLWFNLEGLKPGHYNLVIINPPLEETVLNRAFTIIEPKTVKDDTFYRNLPWGTDLLIGFPLADAIFDASLMNYTFADGEGLFSPFPEMELNIKSDMNTVHPILKYIGAQFRIASLPPIGGGYYFNTIAMGIYGRTRFTYPVNVYGEALMGYRWMKLNVEDRDLYAQGSLFTVGAGLTINYDRFLIDVSAKRDAWIMEDGYVNVNQISLKFGHRF